MSEEIGSFEYININKDLGQICIELINIVKSIDKLACSEEKALMKARLNKVLSNCLSNMVSTL